MTSSLAPETYATLAAALAGAVVVAKKLITRHRAKPEPPLTRAEFDEGLESTRNRICAGYLALSDKIDAKHEEVLAAMSDQAATVERRLDRLDTAVARLDERTKSF